MRRLLIISLTDYKREPNGRIHHLVQHMRVHWDRVTVVYGAHAEPGPLGRVLKASLQFGSSVREEGNLREVRVHPFLNTPESLAKRVTGYPGSLPGRLRRLRLGAERTLSTLGIIRDLSQIAFFALAVRRHAPGPFDACLVQCPLSGCVGLRLRRSRAARVLVYDDIDYAPGWCDHRARRVWVEHLERQGICAADIVICAGSLLGERRASQIGRPVPVIPNGVELELFRPAREKVPHPPTVVYTGRVIDWAGLEVGFAALARARREVPGLRFLVIGRSDPAYERRLRQHAESLGVGEAIQWIGEVAYSGLPSHLEASDVGYAAFRPTLMKRYAFPLKVVEYMAAGLPVLGTRGTETERILVAHECGEVVDHDATAISAGLVRLFRDRERRQRLAANAARGSEAYDWKQLMERVQAVLEEAVPAGRPAGA